MEMEKTGMPSPELLELFSAIKFTESKQNKTQHNSHPQPWCGKHVNDQENSKNIYNYALKPGNEKTPMCKIAELTRYHKLKHEYVLMDESGPAHKKKFTVKLVLKEGEEYEGSGASIKKAQQSAAEKALENTTLKRPSRKANKSKNDNNPVWLLFNVANRLGIEVKLEHEHVNQRKPILQFSLVNSGYNNNILNPVNDFSTHGGYYLYNNQYFGYPYPPVCPPYFNNYSNYRDNGFDANQINKPKLTGRVKNDQYHRCTFVLSDGTSHKGAGKTLGFAKNEAATKALFHLRPLLSEQEAKLKKDYCNFEDNDDAEVSSLESDVEVIDTNDDDNDTLTAPTRKSKKSVVSEIHEAAFRLKMNVELEIVNETGEPHNRNYTLRCRLTSPKTGQVIEADGNGSSKKVAKQDACKNMLEKVADLENDPVYLASLIVKSSNNPKKATKEVKRKTIVKDMKMDPQYGHHINPISRLIQVMQTRKEADPVFKLVGEQGQNRYREFMVEVRCMDRVVTGVGQNKKLAKRAAAEAMLSEIGYVKSMPQPGKSLLKKKSNDDIKCVMSDIGVFDATQLESKNAEDDAHVSPVMQTFADVEAVVNEEQNVPENDDYCVVRPRADSEKQPIDLPPMRSERRRVTFSTEVAQCPPPEDSNYPMSSVTLLKSEVVVAPKLKKRGRDSKKALSATEKSTIASLCRYFLTYSMAESTRSGIVNLDDPTFKAVVSKDVPSATFKCDLLTSSFNQASEYTHKMSQQLHEDIEHGVVVVKSAKWLLETLAKLYKFTVSYSDFPKASDSENFFSIVTIGLDKPILLPGTGTDEDGAHLDAAYHGIEALVKLDKAN
ncbi:unnamed protein product [Bursaphelenchus okinawaensis]|uniref:DRBM domain-containing protein n=1 Tax=Bursaphelenchus okinawaensis TaxID=465554 RepID=A0A811LIG3_9BILA|nr:unnamed protein product [Bursaphelenchus okinawaensis]CAG9126518.1 unnamed protein product [Bursaphelenchus okinawaensis]